MFNINDAYENALIEQKLSEEYVGSRLDKMNKVDIFEATPEEILGMKTSKPFIDMYKCHRCKHIFSKDEMENDTLTMSGHSPEYAGFDNFIDRKYEYEEEIEKCPYCNSTDIFTLYTDDLDGTLVNVDDYIEGFTAYLDKWFKTQENNKITESEDKEKQEKEQQENEKQDKDKKKPEKDDKDFTKLKDTVKKEMYKYLKSNGIDIDHLIKSGVELDSMKPVIDKMLDTYVATSVADYENEFNIGLAWDYELSNNDIIITIETM